MFSHQRFLKWAKSPATLAQTAAFLLLPALAATAAWLPPQTRHALTQHLPAISLPTLARQAATSDESPRARWIQTSAPATSGAAPVIASVSSHVVTGSLRAAPDSAFRLDFFAAPDADSEQNQSYLGSVNVTTNGSGDATFRFVSPSDLNGQFVSATATAQNGAVSAPSRAVSAPITNCSTVVTTNADAGAGSLRAAITCANLDVDANTISFNIAGAGDKTIALSSTLPTLANTLTIFNGQPTTLTVSGGNAVRIFRTAPGANVTLRNLILSGGKATGSTQDAQRGGAIFNDNALLSVIDCNLSGNRADSQGGAIYALGSAGSVGVTLLRCTLSDNRVSGGAGGAIFTGSSASGTVNLEMTRCLFQSNSASTGGALFNGGGNALITESSLLANSAAGGGAITNDAFSTSTTVQLVRSTLAQNTAFSDGAAIANRNDNGNETASLIVSNSTFSDNAVGNNSGQGGAIFNAAYFGPAQVTVSDSTFARNSATNGANLYNEGSSATRKAVMTLKNSIFQRGANTGMATVTTNFYNQSAAGDTNSANSTITSAGNNLSDDSNNFLIQSTDRQNRDPKLGALANNGGPTQTVALLAGSPAIDAGNTTSTTDQRGIARPQGSADDIGAYEFAAAAPAKADTTTTLTSTRNPSTAGQAVSIIITVRPTSGSGRAGGTVTLKDGATTVFTSPLAVDTMGNGATAYNASNLSPGTHSFNATYSGDASNNGSTSAVLRQVVNADTSACSTVVTTNADASAGSLRAAVDCSNTTSGAQTVTFAPNIKGTIPLTSGQITISDGVTITGPGASVLSVSGNRASRVFFIQPNLTTAISGLTISGGQTNAVQGDATGGRGGGIYNAFATPPVGKLTLSGVTVSGNQANNNLGFAGDGGGVYGGNLVLTGCAVSGNSAPNGDGGGVYGYAVTATGSTFSGNTAKFSGGGISTAQNLDVTNATLQNNAAAFGGAMSGRNTTVSNSSVSNNRATSGNGGGLNVLGTLTMQGSTVSANTAQQQGGGLRLNGAATLINVSVSGNRATDGDGGGIFSGSALTLTATTVAGNFSKTFGGGIYNFGSGASVIMTQSTLSGNTTSARGGAMYCQNAQLLNCTVSGNTGGELGGGIYGEGVRLLNATVSGNTALKTGVTSRAGGVFTVKGLDTGNSIIVGNVANELADFTSLGNESFSRGYNLIGQTDFSFNQGGDRVGVTDAKLGPLQNNGGPTQTRALLAGSPALNAGNPDATGLPTTDQRGAGFARIVGGRVDIGSYELQTVTPTKINTATTLTSSRNPSQVGHSVTFSARVTPASGAATPTGTVTFRDGATTIGTGTVTNGVATYATTTLSAGTHSISAVYGGNATFNASTSATLRQVVNAAPTPIPSLSVADAQTLEGNSGTKTLAFTVTATRNGFVGPISARVNTANITATAGSDYVAVVGGTLTIPAGQNSATFNVTINGDTIVEANETFGVTLSAPTSANTTFGRASATGTITNDDAAPILPRLSINDATAPEGNGGSKPLVFTVTLAPASTQSVTVRYATANGTASMGNDYSSNAGTLTFAPGQTTQTIPVTVIGDLVREANETFSANLSAPTNAALAKATGIGTIQNDDFVADLSVAQSATPTSVPRGGQVTFSIVVKNNGPDVAANVTLTDVLPTGATLISSTPTATSNGSTLTYALGTIASGASKTVVIRVQTPNTVGTSTNRASATQIGASDATPANNSATATVSVTAGAPAYAYSVGKLINVGPYSPSLYRAGARFVQDVTITNNGTAPANAPLQLVLDGLPASVSLINASGTASNGKPFVNLPGNLAVGQSVTVRLQFRLNRSDKPSFTPRVENAGLARR